MSLKSKLNEAIRINGTMTYNELKNMTEELGYKVDNMTRRLRPSESPDIESVKKNGAIVAYKYKKADLFVDMGITDKPTKPTFGSTADIYKLRKR